MSTAVLADPAPRAGQSLLGGYRSTAGHDELVDRHGQVRPHWRPFLDGFAALGADGRQQAQDSTTRALRETGIAFNVWADPDDRAHAWRLDLVPVLLGEADWRRLAAGLVQRARLLDAALGDLYGPARLLRDGLVPPALVLGSDDYVRAEVRPEQRPRRFLHTYACDVARGPDGDWLVLGDQCDAVAGHGYLLASRVALSHGLAELFQDCRVQRLAGYFQRVQQSLADASGRDDGRIVVLAPGPSSPGYFSHAYLARYLGYSLCEAGDLTVRDNLLQLKTLDGLQRVDLVLRKTPGREIDPLHLPGSGLAGVPGLLQVARAGRVTLVNRAGSGVLMNRAVAPYAARLCRALLGEDAILRDPPARWLGAAAAAATLTDGPWSLVPATARNEPGLPIMVSGYDPASATARARLAELMARDGHRWIATRPVELATTPVLDGAELRPQPYAMRCFLAFDGSDWQVLPGALVRLAGGPTAVALPNGFGSKDLWCSGGSTDGQQLSLLRGTLREVHLRRVGRDLLSRTTDNLFWLGRYAERTEGTIRLVRAVLGRLLEDGRGDVEAEVLGRLLDLVLAKGVEGEAPALGADPAALEGAATILVFAQRPYGLRDCLDHVHRTATLVREQISNDAWRVLNLLHTDRRWRQPPRRVLGRATLELLDDGIRALNAFAGTEAENMTRNWAWRFLEIGRRLERAAQLTEFVRLLVCGSPMPEGDGSLRLLLELGDSGMTYRSRYLMTPLTAPALDLLLLDETNPRSLAFQLTELERHLAILPVEGPHRSAEQRLILRLVAQLRLVEIGELAQIEGGDAKPALAALLDGIANGVAALSDLLVTTYFAHAEVSVSTLAASRLAAEP